MSVESVVATAPAMAVVDHPRDKPESGVDRPSKMTHGAKASV